MELDCDITGPWEVDQAALDGWDELAQRALDALAAHETSLANARLSASILFTDDGTVHRLNSEWRGKDRATNVLSFPMIARDDLLDLAPDGPPVLLGDIALAHGVCVREAGEKGISVADHAAHLIVHGLLHLAGHDHEISDEDADAMERIETLTLAQMGIADPYDATTRKEG